MNLAFFMDRSPYRFPYLRARSPESVHPRDFLAKMSVPSYFTFLHPTVIPRGSGASHKLAEKGGFFSDRPITNCLASIISFNRFFSQQHSRQNIRTFLFVSHQRQKISDSIWKIRPSHLEALGGTFPGYPPMKKLTLVLALLQSMKSRVFSPETRLLRLFSSH